MHFIDTHFIDTHCHFDFPPFIENITQSLQLAAQAGVNKIIIPSIGITNSQRILELAIEHPALYAALGLHPIYTHQPDDFKKLFSLITNYQPYVVAIGEIGLDFYIQSDNQLQLQQQNQLIQQLHYANDFDLPVILHSRKSHDRLLAILKKQRVKRTGVIHGFAGSFEQANQFVQLGYSIGVGGTITYQRANKTRQAIAQLPLTSLLLETDSPDMPVYGFQGQPNRPERLTIIFDALCSLRLESPQEIAQQLYKNSCKLFLLNKPLQ